MFKEIYFREGETQSYYPKKENEVAFITGLPLPETDFDLNHSFNVQPSALPSGLLVFNMVHPDYGDYCQVQIYTDSDPKHTTYTFCAHAGLPENHIPDEMAIQVAFKLLPDLLSNYLQSFNDKLI